MNRTLKRPMFRMGGMPAEGITSGLDKPEMKMASADMDVKLKELTEAFILYKQQGGTLSFEDFSKLFAQENFNSGGRVGLQNGTPNPFASNLAPGTLPGFLTSFGLDLLSRPPQGGLFSTIASSARGPLEQLQAGELRRAELAGERRFKEELAEKEQQAAMDRLTKKIESDEKIAGAEKELTVSQLTAEYLSEFQGDLNKATNKAKYFVEERPALAEQYGQKQMGGVIEINLNDPKSIQRAANLKKKDINKIFYELNTGSVLKLIRDPGSKKLTFSVLDRNQTGDDTGEILNQTVDTSQRTPGLFGQETKPNIVGPAIERLGEEFSSDFYQG